MEARLEDVAVNEPSMRFSFGPLRVKTRLKPALRNLLLPKLGSASKLWRAQRAVF